MIILGFDSMMQEKSLRAKTQLGLKLEFSAKDNCSYESY